jgi:hypothetical protein
LSVAASVSCVCGGKEKAADASEASPLWLPGLPSQSVVLWDRLVLEIKHMASGQMKITAPDRHVDRCNPTAMTHEILGDTT